MTCLRVCLQIPSHPGNLTFINLTEGSSFAELHVGRVSTSNGYCGSSPSWLRRENDSPHVRLPTVAKASRKAHWSSLIWDCSVNARVYCQKNCCSKRAWLCICLSCTASIPTHYSPCVPCTKKQLESNFSQPLLIICHSPFLQTIVKEIFTGTMSAGASASPSCARSLAHNLSPRRACCPEV